MCSTKTYKLKKRNKKLDLIHIRLILSRLQEENRRLKNIQYKNGSNYSESSSDSEVSDSESPQSGEPTEN